jgi:hypothetical protein
MSDFNIRSESVNVEQIMQQIRARIREKRGVDYTEAQIRELASVKLERFLDPQKVRSGLLQQFREGRPLTLPKYTFEDSTLFETHRPILRKLRSLFQPILKLFINVNPLIHALHTQVDINALQAEHEAQVSALSFELLHNLVLETTKLGIEVKNLKMRVESLSSRFEFAERRARALEGVVQYRPGQSPEETFEAPADPQQAKGGPAPADGDAAQPGAEGRRRRRRRRGRRGGTGRPTADGQSAAAGPDDEGGGSDEPGDGGPDTPESDDPQTPERDDS